MTANGLTRALCLGVLALLNLGALLRVTTDAGTLNVPGAFFPAALLVLHVGLLVISRPSAPRSTGAAWLLGMVIAISLVPSVLITAGGPAALVAYAGFALGTVGGILVGAEWGRDRLALIGSIDVLLAVFAVATAASLIASVEAAPGSAEFHALAHTSWGGSNLVAAVLVVLAWALVARATEVQGGRWLWAAAVVAVIGAAATVSRGAALAGIVGLIVACWTLPRTSRTRRVMSWASVGVALAGAAALLAINALRDRGGAQAGANVDARFELMRLAWDSFGQSPILGTGWLGLRQVADGALANQSYAHNVVFSFIQVGGIGGLVFLVLLVGAAIRGIRIRPTFAPSIAAALTASMTDPFFENFVGASASWLVILAANVGGKAESELPYGRIAGDVMQTPAARVLTT